jgi:PTH1 family peptidyl-tRNA hydrolase
VTPLGDLLVVGLGNPGERYAGTRHNVGADAVLTLAARTDTRLRAHTNVSAFHRPARVGSVRVDLAIPTTYMNESGRAVSQLVRRHGPLGWDRLLVVHDELDLEPGVVKLKSGGGLAGHNGLRSISTHLRTQDFARVRIGVGKPPGGAQHGASWVLSKVTGSEREVLRESVQRAADAIEAVATEGIDAAMATVNARR